MLLIIINIQSLTVHIHHILFTLDNSLGVVIDSVYVKLQYAAYVVYWKLHPLAIEVHIVHIKLVM